MEEILLNLNIGNQEFFEYMQERTKVMDEIDTSWYGVFPIVSVKGILQDIRMLIPSPSNEYNTLICIREYTHAFELYQELGLEYKDNRLEREQRARIKENEYKMALK